MIYPAVIKSLHLTTTIHLYLRDFSLICITKYRPIVLLKSFSGKKYKIATTFHFEVDNPLRPFFASLHISKIELVSTTQDTISSNGFRSMGLGSIQGKLVSGRSHQINDSRAIRSNIERITKRTNWAPADGQCDLLRCVFYPEYLSYKKTKHALVIPYKCVAVKDRDYCSLDHPISFPFD